MLSKLYVILPMHIGRSCVLYEFACICILKIASEIKLFLEISSIYWLKHIYDDLLILHLFVFLLLSL